MHRLSLKPFLLALAGAALVLSACGSSRTAAPRQQAQIPQQATPAPVKPAPVRDENIVLALLAPQSGANQGAASVGRALVQAARLGVQDLNDRRVELRIYDTAGDPARGADMARRAVSDGADIILGPLFGSVTEAVAPIASGAGIKVLSFSTDSSVAGGPVWVTGYLPEMEARRILSFAASRGRNAVGIFYPATPYGEAALRGARETSTGFAQVIGSASFQPGFAGVEAGAEQFAGAAAGADAVLIASGGNDLRSAGSFLDFYNFNPQRVQYLGLGQWFSSSTLREKSLLGGWFPAPEPEAANRFSERFAQQFGEKPRFLATLGYDAVQIAGQAAKAARSSAGADPFSVETLTRPEGYEGAVGRVRLTRDGRNERALAILTVEAQGFATLDPAPRSFAAGF